MESTIFITGASSGLGKAAAKLFHSKGWHVIATMRNPERETELSLLGNVTLLPLDVTDVLQMQQTIEQACRLHTVDVVLNNAGYGLVGPLEALTEAQIHAQVTTNLLGVIHVSRLFVPYFRERNAGTFINVTSMFGLAGFPTCSVYSATKFGVDGFSEALAYELAAFHIGVKVVAPGGIQTDFAGRSLQAAGHAAYELVMAKVREGYSPEQYARYATAEDVAAVVYQAATDGKHQLRYVAGQDAMALYQERLEFGPEPQVQKIRAQFAG